jgi:hypothetical protein
MQVRVTDEPTCKNLQGLRKGAIAIMFCPAGHLEFPDNKRQLDSPLSYEIEIVDWSPPPVEK